MKLDADLTLSIKIKSIKINIPACKRLTIKPLEEKAGINFPDLTRSSKILNNKLKQQKKKVNEFIKIKNLYIKEQQESKKTA